MAGIDGLAYGDVVTAEQMKNLFGEGRNPVTGVLLGRAYQSDSVAGFDLTFSPVKSISALWALAPPEVARAIRRAHNAAVLDALDFLEQHAVFTREGTGGVRQVETRGLVAASFLHRDSRAGDPDLHTHVAVANKVQTQQGRWLSIYGTVLHEHVVAASEAYNTALEHHLHDALGVRFVEVSAGRGKRPVREIAGVEPALCTRWSRRRRDIEDRVGVLSEEFTAAHGRPPTVKQSIALAQRANLETREAKHEPHSEAEQRAAWHTEAIAALGTRGLEETIDAALHPLPAPSGSSGPRTPVSDRWVAEAAERVIAELEAHRATWQSWHLYAEAQRLVRDLDVPADQVPGIVEHLVESTTQQLINLTPDHDPVTEPPGLCRSDGTSVYRHTGADHFTTQRMLAAEERLVTAAGRRSVDSPDPVDVELALMKRQLDGTILNAGQRELVETMVADPRQVVLALAPAGSGKTTAMNALARVCDDLGYKTVGLAPSAAAAGVLGEATGIPTETLAKLDHAVAGGHEVDLGPRTVVVIDEAGMADTPTLDRVIAACTQAGARVRLIGDDRQLAAVGAGGVLRDIATTHGALRLEEVVRFADPVEAAASLDLRAGDRGALGFYLDNDRIHTGDELTCLVDVLTAWDADQRAGRECLMSDGSLHVRHLRSRLHTVLPREYVAAHVELGYATTVHAAQGSTADVTHGILTGSEDRQLLYTMLTRGRAENHLHLILDQLEDGRGEEDFLPGLTEQLTAVGTLDRIVDRDGAAVSATTQLAHATSPTALLQQAAQRYADAVTTTAHRLLGADADDALEAAGAGPLPWLPGLPAGLRQHPHWSAYLTARADRVTELAEQVHHHTALPDALGRYDDVLPRRLRDQILVWRAANGIAEEDRSLLGRHTTDLAADRHARHLQRQIDDLYPPSVRRWEDRIAALIGRPELRDQHTLDLARQLDRLERGGMNAGGLLRRAASSQSPLPDEHTIEALAYRVQRLIRPARSVGAPGPHREPTRRAEGLGL